MMKNALVRITAKAWLKMQALVVGYDKEVGWYMTVEKLGFGEYRVKDVLVYPQLVTGATVEDTIQGDDAVEMIQWLDTLTDEQYVERRGQGHSHVNMGVTPSSTDTDFFKRFGTSVKKATVNPYAITMILNKKFEMMMWAIDWEDKVEYTNSAIDVVFEVEDGVSNVEFFENSKSLVRTVELYKPSSYYLFGGNEKAQSLAGSLVFCKPQQYQYGNGYYNRKNNAVLDINELLEDVGMEPENSLSQKDKDDSTGYEEQCYGITLNDYTSSAINIKQILPKNWAVTCLDVFGNEYGFNCNTKNPIATNKMADPNSVAMMIYDTFNENALIDYFTLCDTNDELIFMSDINEVKSVLAAQVVDYEIAEVSTQDGRTETVLYIAIEKKQEDK